jgi:AAA domain-containing protein/bifunctional DNA primase/polymerase-like protein
MTETRTREQLLETYGRFYGDQRFAVTFTAAVDGDDAKRVRGPWDRTGRLADGNFGAALVGNRGKSRNPAIVLRPSELIVLECDTEDDLARIQTLGLPETLTVRSSKPYKRHYYFRPDPTMEMLPYVAFRFESGKLTADTGRYFLAPPAVHPTGAVYSFTAGHGPGEIAIATLPEKLYRKLAEQSDTETREQRSSLNLDPEAKIREGNRRDYIFRFACMQRRWGLSEQQILDAALIFNRDRCEPPLAHDQVAIQVTGAMKKDGGQEIQAAQTVTVSTPPEPDQERTIKVRPLADVTMRSIEWLEKPLWQKSAFQLLAGPKGSGKGTYLAALAARITNAGSNAVFISTEDSAEIDLKPRLVAAGADITRCFDIPMHIRLPEDIYELQKVALEIGGVGLFVVDPVANHIGDRDSNAEASIREAIAPLNWLANALSCLLIGVRHPGKDRTRGALTSILGSTAWVDVPRAVVVIAKDDKDDLVRHIQVVAGNRSLNGKAQHFRIGAKTVEDLAEPITYAIDLGQSEKNVDDLLAITIKEPSKTDKAKAVLLDILEERGDQNSDKLDAEVGEKVGLAPKTIRNVRAELKNEGLIRVRVVKDEESGLTDHWIVYRTLEPRQGHHFQSPEPDPGSTSRALDENDPHPDSLNDPSGTGSLLPDPLHTSNGLYVKQAKNEENKRQVGIQSPTHAEPPRARLPFAAIDDQPPPDDSGYDEARDNELNGHHVDWNADL